MSQIEQDILVFAAPSTASPACLSSASSNTLRLARTLTSGRLIAFGPSSLDSSQVAQCGADSLYVYTDDKGTKQLVSQDLTACTLGVLDQLEAAGDLAQLGAVLLPSTLWGKDSAGQLAILLGSAAATDIATLSTDGENLIASKSVLGGTWSTSFSLDHGSAVLALVGESNSCENSENTQMRVIEVAPRELPEAAQPLAFEPNSSEGPSLTEAKVVVCVGRGVANQMELPRALAEKLGGALGATRVVCEEGWMPRSAQIGQSGVSVAPDLYIGLGVSGDPYHVCGIRASKRIVAIVDDPAAPILEIADFGIVGKLEEVLPELLEQLG